MTERFDIVELQMIWARMISIVDEAAKVIVRTSFSTLANEANDFACVLTDARGFSLAQNSGSIPSFIGTLPATVRHFLEKFGADGLYPGDVLVTNDPWMGTGHLNDISVVRPVFVDETLVGFAATTSHVPDIGGKVRSTLPREVFEEGFQIPLMKLVSQGETNEALVELLKANVRTPLQTTGDVWAQVNALDLMERRVQDMMAERGLVTLETIANNLFERTETAMRSKIESLPDGVYNYAFQTDGLDEPFDFKLTLEISVDTVRCDYTGTAPVQPRAFNCPLTYTRAMTVFALKCALLPDIPNNEGLLRPIETFAPEDCCLNPKYPAAVGARINTGHYVPILIFGALREICNDTVMAGVGSPLWNLTQTGLREDGSPYASVLFFNGGMGASADRDGEPALSWPSNISATPVEVAERQSPFLFRYKRLRPGSGGHGARRGGLGEDILMESRSERPVQVTFLAERTRFGAPGFNGGQDGVPGAVWVRGSKADPRQQYELDRGDTVLMSTPGGGGFGDPQERPDDLRRHDARQGYLRATAK
ncbi:hydantoinase B/oxoprolinase family protein [Roseovarius sp.]|uniref:hydantoinase B/oxoprolinase family protein n=1 Tax=Roseovarius sp. TaxID=1486281 RepID=UPI00356681FD